MIEALLTGWSRLFAAGGVVLVPPAGASGRIRIHDRAAPRSMRALVEGLRAGAPAGAELSLSDGPRPLVTVEGEHAAFVECRIGLGDDLVQRSVGVVIGDDHFALIDGRVEDPALFASYHALVEALTRAYCLGLGAARWRAYFYGPPPGWQGISRVRAHLWLAPGYPHERATVTAFHARPLLANAAIRQHRLLYEDVTREMHRATGLARAPANDAGLVGQMAEFKGENLRVVNVAYEDERFAYLLRLETDEARHQHGRTVFDAVLRSVRPIPHAVSDAVSLDGWVD